MIGTWKLISHILTLLISIPNIIESKLNNYDKIGQHFNLTDKQILDQIIIPDKYDYRMRPEEKTIVNLSILILTLSSPDESSVTYEIGFVLMQRWYDPRLRFELPDALLLDTKNSNSIYLNGLKHTDRIWIPDTYFIKHGEFRHTTDQFDPLHITLKIFPNGTVLYTTRRNMILTCEGNLRIFPFDSPKCFFGIESLSHEKDQIRFQWDEQVSIKTSDSLKTINAYMTRNETNRCNKRHSWRREFSCLSVLLIFSRDQSFYFTTVFVPGNQQQQQQQQRTSTRSKQDSFTRQDFSFRNKSLRNIYNRDEPTPLPTSSITREHMDNLPKKKFRRQQTTELDIRIAKSNYARAATTNIPTAATATTTATSSALAMTTGTDTGSESENIDPLSGDYYRPNYQRRSAIGSTTTALNQSFRVRVNNNNNMQPTLSEEQETEKLNVQQMKNIVMEWIKRPYLFTASEQYSSNEQLARSIDHISKTVFTLTFGLFSFFYFLTYAFIKPAQLDDWIEKEFEASDW
ncbi:uncharacterized protein LOC124495898 isoform X2 [Dermatophagoides farinae]|uniref:uncharacterized protein LOC124495898 isoform X2 n=1 Tax=Dermatophagoides farinae TaxID=6954 RepID=UPI001F1136DA|nr:uncharacterized protein LOC124495898 isoform X2 [Dermatophagoides farinae]